MSKKRKSAKVPGIYVGPIFKDTVVKKTRNVGLGTLLDKVPRHKAQMRRFGQIGQGTNAERREANGSKGANDERPRSLDEASQASQPHG